MTTEEFLEELAAVRNQFAWTLQADVRTAKERRSRPRFHLRCCYKSSVAFDPIGAVCYIRTGLAYGPKCSKEAAVAMGLPMEAATDLISAARDQTWSTSAGSRQADENLQVLRAQLIRTVLPEAGTAC